MFSVRFRNHLYFAMRKETSVERGDIPFHRLEKIGNVFSWFGYEFRRTLAKCLTNPKILTVLFTLIAMTINGFIFYPFRTFMYLLDILIWVLLHVNWGYVRFVLWIVSEATILGIGLRALGRFSNSDLMNKYLIPQQPPFSTPQQ